MLLRTYAAGELEEHCVVFGDRAVLTEAARRLDLNVAFRVIDHPSDWQSGELNVIDAGLVRPQDISPGEINTRAGHAARQYVVDATQAACQSEVSALVTLPINKAATQASHPDFSGHTELLAQLCGVTDVVLMLATDQVAVSHVSAHVSLREAIARVTPARLRRVIDLTAQALSRFGSNPRIAVCGLNPHAGESGLFGNEEATVITPTIEAAIQSGVAVSGPYPADTVFRQAIELDRYDAVVCMYHDQGHAPMKLIAFDHAVNVTLGLPIIRTSVDHGTAFDIAWQGIASNRSLLAAIRYALKLLHRT